MKEINFFAMIFALLVGLIGFATSAHCQTGDQSGSVAISGAIRPAVGSTSELDEFAECVSKMKEAGASYKEASKDCREYRKVLAKESTRIANEAADATKASRPMIYGGYGRYGYGYGYGYGFSGYGYSYPRRTVVARPPAPPRPAPPPRPAAPPRPTPSR